MTMTRSKRTRTRATSTNNKKDDNTISILKNICKSNCIQLPPAANDRGGTTSIGAIVCNIYHQFLSPNKWITHRAGGDKADWIFIPCNLIEKHTVAEIKRNGQIDVHFFYGWEKLALMIIRFGLFYAPSSLTVDDSSKKKEKNEDDEEEIVDASCRPAGRKRSRTTTHDDQNNNNTSAAAAAVSPHLQQTQTTVPSSPSSSTCSDLPSYKFKAIDEVRGNKKRRVYGTSIKPIWPKNNYNYKDMSSVNLITWDEIKCRVIVLPRPKETTTSSYDNTNTIPSNSKVIENDDNTKKASNNSMKRVYRTHYNRKIGLRKRGINIDLDTIISSPGRGSPPSSCCGTPSSGNLVATRKESKGNDNVTIPIGRVVADVKRASSEASIEDDRNTYAQPNSRSNLASARAYFRYIDSHKLNLIYDTAT